MSFSIGNIIREKLDNTQKFEVVKLNPFSIQGSYKIKFSSGTKYNVGDQFVITPHNDKKNHQHDVSNYELSPLDNIL